MMKWKSLLAVLSVSALLVTTGCGSQIPPIFASPANNGGNFKIIAIRKGTTLNQELIVSPQAKENIKTVADLKGKKVGYVKNTTAQYFLYKMLSEAGLKWTDIDALPMSTSDGLSAITTGDIDALASDIIKGQVAAVPIENSLSLRSEAALKVFFGYMPHLSLFVSEQICT